MHSRSVHTQESIASQNRRSLHCYKFVQCDQNRVIIPRLAPTGTNASKMLSNHSGGGSLDWSGEGRDTVVGLSVLR